MPQYQVQFSHKPPFFGESRRTVLLTIKEESKEAAMKLAQKLLTESEVYEGLDPIVIDAVELVET